jgi:hypothetical protein
MLIKAGDIISKSIALYRDNWKQFLLYTILTIVPFFVVGIIIFGLMTGAAITGSYPLMIVAILVLIILGILAWAISFIISIALIRIIATRYLGKEIKQIKLELKEAKSLFWSALLASILGGLAIFGGTLLLIIPGIIFAVWFMFAVHSAVLDKTDVIESLKKSKGLASGRWWSVLWRLIAPGFIFYLTTLLVQMVLSLPIQFGGDNLVVAIIMGILSISFNILIAPLYTIALTMLYIELKKTPLVPSATPKQ